MVRRTVLAVGAALLLFSGTILVGGNVGALVGGDGGEQENNQVVFEATGDAQVFTVPADVCSVNITADGAQGGNGAAPNGGTGGLGGSAAATIAVTPGETLQVFVGGRGADGSVDEFGAPNGADGGGASDVRQGGTDLEHRVVVGGGGGGAADQTNGGSGGGTAGTAGGGAYGGGGGTQSAGGAAGGGDATAGSLGFGGNGGNAAPQGSGGGGGGGGYYGGGGGGPNAVGDPNPPGGGGGGSGFTPDGSGLTAGVRSGDGQVMITWTPEPGCDVGPAPPAPPAAPVAAEPSFTG